MADLPVTQAELKTAWQLFKSGDWNAAVGRFRAILERDPDNAQAHLRLGRVLAARGEAAAEFHLRRAEALAPDVAPRVALGDHLVRARRWDEAITMFEAALVLDARCIAALLGMAKIRIREKRHSAGYALFDRVLEIDPCHAEAWARYSKALNDHAIRVLERAPEFEGHDPEQAASHRRLAHELNDKALSAARRACDLEPASAKASRALAGALATAGQFAEAEAVLGRAVREGSIAGTELGVVKRLVVVGAAARRRPAIWPRQARQFADLEQLIRDFVLPGSAPAEPILTPASRVVTLGSCFAEHIANSLHEQGVDVFFRKRGEAIDNLYATRHLLEWAAGERSLSDDVSGGDGGVLYRNRFETADVVILSLGVSAAYFDRSTGEFVLAGASVFDKGQLAQSCDFRMISLQENVENLHRIIQLIRGFNRATRLVLTVSPVPLAATFDRLSAVQADSVSKSTLRLAAETVVRAQVAGVYYWPSFEIVRWLGAHLQGGYPPVFGADDGASRHVSLWLVRLIIRLFLETFGEGFAPKAAEAVAS